MKQLCKNCFHYSDCFALLSASVINDCEFHQPTKAEVVEMKQTCKECVHWDNCKELVCTLTGVETKCDWEPSKFKPAPSNMVRNEFNTWFMHQLYLQESCLMRDILRDCKKELFKAWAKRDPTGSI